MTQSGQGEEPSARPAHEGIVLPSDGGEPLLPGTTGAPAPSAPPGGQTWGGEWGPGQEAPQPGQGWPPAATQQWPAPEQPGGPGPMPPEGAPAPSYGGESYPRYGDASGGQGYPAAGDANGAQGYPASGAPMPPMHEAATQYMPPVPGAGPEGATQYIPPVPGGGAEAATQYIPPVGGGALPPEMGGPAQQQPGHAHAEAATQYIPPYPGDDGERQPPAEFDNLFRGPQAGEGATQQMPRVPSAPVGQAPVISGQPAYRPPMDEDDGGRRGGGRTGSRVPVIAAVGIGIVVLGIGAGALLSSGGDDKKPDPTPAAASAPASAEPSASAADDPAKQQAVALDKVLADSGNSRAQVIRSVENVKACRDLGKAAADLRDAARQRNELVTRLGKLSLDKLPDNAALKDALTKAWQASASADNHYAAWAGQAAGRRGCAKGHARATNQTQAGDRASGTASAQKTRAAQLWNAIATKYGLTTRQTTQL
ncbi:hypothetical protein [Streptomyces sp. LaPpAH-108]|uniref:hypothetical protein n=1 Tax=Streptomyces sp. LaPpAH-108 TaxID=1155714 RepID=UPI0003A487F0|nr:hypothetical protein [Streptomyces sp. LaPpAH-108]